MTETNQHVSSPQSRSFPRSRVLLVSVVALIAALVAAGATALLVNIIERKEEARNPFYLVVALTDETEDPAIWGKNFPLQYDAYRRTVDQVRTRFGGSEAVPRTPTDADPRSIVARSRLEEDPRLMTMWAGYPFATDTREARGHAYMLEDATFTERHIAARQPGTCLHVTAQLGTRDCCSCRLVIGSRPSCQTKCHPQELVRKIGPRHQWRFAH